uniref:Uncharacterized protein n=1 Tax=Ciona savignyi TaxID=51511 RepID=H2ZCM7_CIOSA
MKDATNISVELPPTPPRKFNCEMNVLKNTDGSALYSEGDTEVMVGVYGPADLKENKQEVHEALVDVDFRPKHGSPTLAEKYLMQFIQGVCENAIMLTLHPRTVFAIIVQIMQDQGSLLSCAINATCMALQDAGIAMKYMPVAVTVAIKSEVHSDIEDPTDVIIVNPNLKEETESFAVLTYVFDNVKQNLLCTHTRGPMLPKQHERCLETARGATERVLTFFRESITQKVAAGLEI